MWGAWTGVVGFQPSAGLAKRPRVALRSIQVLGHLKMPQFEKKLSTKAKGRADPGLGSAGLGRACRQEQRSSGNEQGMRAMVLFYGLVSVIMSSWGSDTSAIMGVSLNTNHGSLPPTGYLGFLAAQCPHDVASSLNAGEPVQARAWAMPRWQCARSPPTASLTGKKKKLRFCGEGAT